MKGVKHASVAGLASLAPIMTSSTSVGDASSSASSTELTCTMAPESGFLTLITCACSRAFPFGSSKGYQEQSQSSWGKQKWRPDEEDGDGDTPQPRSNKGASDHWSKSRSDWSSMFFLEHHHHCLRGESFLQYVHCLSVQSLNIGMIYIMRWRVEAEGP